jgi:hypothetical protein
MRLNEVRSSAAALGAQATLKPAATTRAVRRTRSGRWLGETHQWQHRQDAPSRPHFGPLATAGGERDCGGYPQICRGSPTCGCCPPLSAGPSTRFFMRRHRVGRLPAQEVPRYVSVQVGRVAGLGGAIVDGPVEVGVADTG